MKKQTKSKITILLAIFFLTFGQIACTYDPDSTIGGQAKKALEGSPIDGTIP